MQPWLKFFFQLLGNRHQRQPEAIRGDFTQARQQPLKRSGVRFPEKALDQWNQGVEGLFGRKDLPFCTRLYTSMKRCVFTFAEANIPPTAPSASLAK